MDFLSLISLDFCIGSTFEQAGFYLFNVCQISCLGILITTEPKKPSGFTSCLFCRLCWHKVTTTERCHKYSSSNECLGEREWTQKYTLGLCLSKIGSDRPSVYTGPSWNRSETDPKLDLIFYRSNFGSIWIHFRLVPEQSRVNRIYLKSQVN